MQDLKVVAIQTSLAWESIDDNLKALSSRINTIASNPDLIILPEMFSTAFSMNSTELAENMDGTAVNWMAEIAAKTHAVITGSLIIKEGDHFYNRLIWMRPDGTHSHYDKRHLFRMMDEDQHFSPGSDRIIVELGGWKICPLICYDLRFPVWSRNNDEYDCLIYVANWPEPRREAWRTLLRARAHENQAYVIGLNRVGKDANDIEFAGDSVILDPKGNVISEGLDKEALIVGSLSYQELVEFREKFPMHLDADKFSVLV